MRLNRYGATILTAEQTTSYIPVGDYFGEYYDGEDWTTFATVDAETVREKLGELGWYGRVGNVTYLGTGIVRYSRIVN